MRRGTFVFGLLLVMAPASASAQKLSASRLGLAPMALEAQHPTRPLRSSARRDVHWKDGALIGFIGGAAAGFFYTRSAEKSSSTYGAMVGFGVLGALVGALIQSSGFSSHSAP